MNTKDLITQKNTVGYVLNSHSSFEEKQSLHPVFKLTENIFTTETNEFFKRFHTVGKPQQALSPVKPISQTPIPFRFYRDPSTDKYKKEDIFLNPSAVYLSKKPYAKSKYSREEQRKKNQSVIIPALKSIHKKNLSQPLDSPCKLPTVLPPSLIPLKGFKSISPRNQHSSGLQVKEMHCEALSHLENFCESIREVPKPSIKKEQKLLSKYSKKMNWISEVLQSYGEYDHKILKELFKYTNDSRNELERERANIVHQIKIGAFDPNKNVVKLRARIKKKKDK